MSLAIPQYAGVTWSRTSRVPVYHISDPQVNAGITPVTMRWWRVPGVAPLPLVGFHSSVVLLLALELASAGCLLKLSLWSIQTPDDLT